MFLTWVTVKKLELRDENKEARNYLAYTHLMATEFKFFKTTQQFDACKTWNERCFVLLVGFGGFSKGGEKLFDTEGSTGSRKRLCGSSFRTLEG